MRERDTGKINTMKKKNKFANRIIVLCIIILIIVTLFTLYSYWRIAEPIPNSVLATICGTWGGELLLICLRQVLGSDLFIKNTTKGDSI